MIISFTTRESAGFICLSIPFLCPRCCGCPVSCVHAVDVLCQCCGCPVSCVNAVSLCPQYCGCTVSMLWVYCVPVSMLWMYCVPAHLWTRCWLHITTNILSTSGELSHKDMHNMWATCWVWQTWQTAQHNGKAVGVEKNLPGNFLSG